MKFTFRNVGTVKETELDLRPFTAIIGPNNSNKTYLAYLVYAMCGRLDRHELSDVPEKFPEPVKLDTRSAFIPTNDNFRASIRRTITTAAILKPDELQEFFQDSSGRLFAQSSVVLQFTDFEIETALNEFIHFASQIPETHGDIDYDKVPNGVVASFSGDMQPDFSFAQYILSCGIIERLSQRPFLLPAERTAFITTYRELAQNRFRRIRDAERKFFARSNTALNPGFLRGQVRVRYPQPVEDFLDFLSDVELSSEPGDNAARDDLSALADQIESGLQDMHAVSYNPVPPRGVELKLDIGEDFTLDLYNASSSIKQLTPLVLYLRHRAQPNDLLIIDEPEMNLHPESQAKLMEILAILVNLGVRVLITTHSPYIMAHLNNVRLAGPASAEQRAEKAESLYLKDARAFLNPDQVMAYEMKDHKLRDLHDPDYGIRWDTLSDVSADLQQTLFKVHTPDEQAG